MTSLAWEFCIQFMSNSFRAFLYFRPRTKFNDFTSKRLFLELSTLYKGKHGNFRWEKLPKIFQIIEHSHRFNISVHLQTIPQCYLLEINRIQSIVMSSSHSVYTVNWAIIDERSWYKIIIYNILVEIRLITKKVFINVSLLYFLCNHCKMKSITAIEIINTSRINVSNGK